MPKVLTCIDWDAQTQTCNAEAWVDQSSWVDYAPTVEQANTIGWHMFIGLATVVVVKRLMFPPEERQLT